MRALAAAALVVAVLVAGPGVALAATGYDKVVVAHEPELYWRLGELSGLVAVDSSGNGHDGTYHGPLALGQPGAVVGDPDTSAAFGGDEYYAAFEPQSGYAGDFTVLVWMKRGVTDHHAGQALVSTRTQAAEYSFDLGLGWWTGVERLQVDVGNGSQWFSTGPGVPFNFEVRRWYQVVATVTSSAVTYYVDGRLIGVERYSIGTGRPLLWDAAHTFIVGDSTRYSSDSFVGGIDEVAVFRRALSADTIRTLYLAASESTPRATTSTTLSSSGNPSPTGQAVTFTATVANAEQPVGVPSGTVTFSADGKTLGEAVTLDAAGRATLTTASLPVGTHEIRAVYSPGSTTFWPSEATLTQAVTRATTTTLTVTPDPTVAGQDATFVATVTPPGATGTVEFAESDGTPLGDPVALAAGRASMVASGHAGHYSVRARYSGDAAFEASVGSVQQTINRADTVTSIVSEPNPVAAGGELELDIWVETVPPGAVQPGGTVAILVDGTDVSGPIPLFGIDDLSAGVAITLTAPDTASADTFGAVYSGDEDTNPSSAPTFQQTVSAPAGASPSLPLAAAPTAVATTPPAAAPRVVATKPPPVATTRAALGAMTKPLVRALRKRGLRALASVRQSLTVNAPGRLTQVVYSPAAPTSGSHARSAKAKPVLVARASRRLSRAGRGTLRLRVTRAGRRLARRGGSLKLQIVTRFKPTAGRTVSASTRLSVKARR